MFTLSQGNLMQVSSKWLLTLHATWCYRIHKIISATWYYITLKWPRYIMPPRFQKFVRTKEILNGARYQHGGEGGENWKSKVPTEKVNQLQIMSRLIFSVYKNKLHWQSVVGRIIYRDCFSSLHVCRYKIIT